MNNKKMGMYYAIGILEGLAKCEKEYKHVKLGEIFNEKYERYELGFSSELKTVVLFKDFKDDKKRYRVTEITSHFNADQIVTLLLQALAYDMKNEEET